MYSRIITMCIDQFFRKILGAFLSSINKRKISSCKRKFILIDWCLMPTLAVFQLYRGVDSF